MSKHDCNLAPLSTLTQPSSIVTAHPASPQRNPIYCSDTSKNSTKMGNLAAVNGFSEKTWTKKFWTLSTKNFLPHNNSLLVKLAILLIEIIVTMCSFVIMIWFFMLYCYLFNSKCYFCNQKCFVKNSVFICLNRFSHQYS